MNLAPIALFVFNRPAHTQQALRHLQADGLAKESVLYVFSDGPRNPAESERVAQVRSILRGAAGFRSVEIVERSENVGIARSIIDGVSRLCRQHGRVIVLEDDLIVSPFFLRYMNSALNKYESMDRVMHVSAYMFPVANAERLPETFFYRATSCWGWGTWQRAWRHFQPDAQLLLRQICERRRVREFNICGTMDYLGMLREQARGNLDSWAIRWYASVFLQGGLSLHPARSLVRNTGHDGSGVHCGTTNAFDVVPAHRSIEWFTDELEESREAVSAMAAFYRSVIGNVPMNWLRKILRRWRQLTRGAGL